MLVILSKAIVILSEEKNLLLLAAGRASTQLARMLATLAHLHGMARALKRRYRQRKGKRRPHVHRALD